MSTTQFEKLVNDIKFIFPEINIIDYYVGYTKDCETNKESKNPPGELDRQYWKFRDFLKNSSIPVSTKNSSTNPVQNPRSLLLIICLLILK